MNKKKSVLGIISVLLWTVIIAVAARLYMEETGVRLPVFWILLLVCAVLIFAWRMYMAVRFRRFMMRFDEAGFKYWVTQNTEGYLRELDECSNMPGVEKFTLSGIPAGHYIALLKINNLRLAGRVEEARTLLETIGPEITSDRARRLWNAEERRLQMQE